MLISIETHITCDFPGGPEPLSPPPLDPHMYIQIVLLGRQIETLVNLGRREQNNPSIFRSWFHFLYVHWIFTMHTNKYGRSYESGKALSRDFKNLVLDELKENYCGNKDTMFVQYGAFSKAAEKFEVSVKTVSNIWREHCCGISTRSAGGRQGIMTRKLSSQDLDYIEYMKMQKPSYTSTKIHAELASVSTTVVQPRTIRRAVQKYLSKPYSFKKIKPVAAERFTHDNLVYTETFMEMLSRVDPYRLRFMDESGFCLPEVARPLYGHAQIGERAIEIVRYHSAPNATLHLLAGLDGIGHFKVTNGASDSYTFVDFITECVYSYTDFGVAALRPGDVLVVDNAPIHHSQISQVLKLWLERQGIDVVFTPRYSPDMNPVENCFSKIKSVVRKPEFGQILWNNFHHAIYTATKTISIRDLHSFFRATGYIAI